MVTDVLRIYVIWDSGSPNGERLANLIASHFDGIGMERDGVSFRVPVRFRSEPWQPGGAPRDIDLCLAKHNAIVLLHDEYMHERHVVWNAYISTLREEMEHRGSDFYIPFGSPTRTPQLACDRAANTQYARRDLWARLPNTDARDQRLLLHLIWTIRHDLRSSCGDQNPEPLFVSHAKADGDDAARAIIDFINDPGHDVPIDTFYDAMELIPGEDFEARFEREIGRGTLLALVSDAYDSRPWCIYELTTAKRKRRPIVLADVGRTRTSRTYPYGANVPKIRVTPDAQSTAWIEPLLVQTLSEGLRCDLSEAHASQIAQDLNINHALTLPRPPELFDIIDSADSLPACVIYPDPPLGKIENDLLAKAIALTGRVIDLKTIGEIS